MGRRVTTDTHEDIVYTLEGEAADVETIIRLRPWMEDEIRDQGKSFTKTQLITDYYRERSIFGFKIYFIK